MDAPKWLADEPVIQQILIRFLDRLDKRKEDSTANKLQSIQLTPKDFPELFFPTGQNDPQQTWNLLWELDTQQLLRVVPNPKIKLSDPEYLNAKVHLLPEKAPVLRRWFNRPHPHDRKHQWHELVQLYADRFPGSTELLAAKPLEQAGLTTEDILQGLAKVGEHLDQDLYLSQISAICFRGDSKFLNDRGELIESLYPGYLTRIRQRPVLLQVALCSSPQGILLIENEDCFLQAMQGRYPHMENRILVFASGFRGSAARVRQPEGVQFFYAPGNQEQRDQFEAYWLNRIPQDWSCQFWGDLDFSGMAILKALRQVFPEMQAWEPGYQPLLAIIQDGHTLEQGKKEKQIDPGFTGCPYADEVLLPALRQYKQGIDQELWLPALS